MYYIIIIFKYYSCNIEADKLNFFNILALSDTNVQ
jgi:hypothetical protein